MNNQQRAAMQGALLALEDAHRRDEHSAARWVYSEAMDALREALAQPQGEWVDLTPNEVTEQIREGAADGGWQGFAQRITTKFKSKNTPLSFVLQGEPIGWTAARNLVDDGYGHSFTVISSEPASPNESYVPIYATPPSVEAAIEATKEKAAKVCDEIERKKWETLTKGGTLDGIAPKDCAAAIRSMK